MCDIQMVFDMRNMQLDLTKLPPALPNENYLSTFGFKTIKNEMILSMKICITVRIMGGKRIRQRNRRT